MRSLQCARAGAALLVVYFHAVVEIWKLYPLFGSELTLFGQCGVDVFFVLSGFIMWQSTGRHPGGVSNFYLKRLVRIAPLYWVLTIAAALVALVAPALLSSTRFDAVHVLTSLAFVPWPNPASLNGRGDLSPVIVPGWTLNFEMMFYLIFGLGLIGSSANRLLRLALLFAVFIAIVILAGPFSPLIAFYDPQMTGEFLLGIAVGVLIERRLFLPWRLAYGLLAVAIVVLVVLDIGIAPAIRFIATGLPAGIIVYSLVSIEQVRRWPSLGWLVRLGDASYSIYLIHIFVLAALRMGWRTLSTVDETRPLLAQIAFVCVALVSSALAGLLVYRYVERPLGLAVNHVLGLRSRSRPAEPDPKSAVGMA